MKHHEHHEQRTQHCHAEPCRFGAAIGGVCASDKGEVEAALNDPGGDQRINEVEMRGRQVFIARKALAGHAALQVAIDAAGGEDAELLRRADDTRVGQHGVTHLRGSRTGDQLAQILGLAERVLNTLLLKNGGEGGVEQRVVAEGRYLLHCFYVAGTGLIDPLFKDIDIQCYKSLSKGRNTVEDDRPQQHDKKDEAGGDGREPVGAKAFLGSVAALGAGVDGEERRPGFRRRVGHSYCSRYLRTM